MSILTLPRLLFPVVPGRAKVPVEGNPDGGDPNVDPEGETASAILGELTTRAANLPETPLKTTARTVVGRGGAGDKEADLGRLRDALALLGYLTNGVADAPRACPTDVITGLSPKEQATCLAELNKTHGIAAAVGDLAAVSCVEEQMVDVRAGMLPPMPFWPLTSRK